MKKNKMSVFNASSTENKLDGLYKKNLCFRHIKDNNYILYAYKSELLVIDCDTSKKIITFSLDEISKNNDLFNLLYDNDFLTNNYDEIDMLPNEGKSFLWTFLRIFLILLFLFSIIAMSVSVKKIGIPNAMDLLNLSVNKIYLLIIGIIFSMLTTILHELMHIIFSNSLNNIKDFLKFSLKNSIAYVSLTHVWTWSLISRLSAISAGVILDIFWLSCISLLRIQQDNWILYVFSTVLLLRIVWQLRFHKKSDGRYFFMMLIDNPLIDIDYKSNKNLLSKTELITWKLCRIFGRVVDLYLLLFWMFPFIYKIFVELGEI